MKEFELKLQRMLERRNTNIEHLSFDQSCHSVAEAAEAVGASPEDFVKNICMIDSNKDIIYSGGGSQRSLVRITPKDLLELNQGKIVRVRK